jgi:alpha-D-ribose 1-methylphosphonate 5-triphosphate synthase subunit PhnH
MSTTIALPGFADPVDEAQTTFRAVLDAMARPGKLLQVSPRLTAPPPLDLATAAVLLTLVDNETPVWLDTTAMAARDWLAFHCGAVIIGTPEETRFAVAFTLPELAALPAGTHEAPENSATLILQVAALGTGARYRLSGPGLREPTLLAATGLPVDFAAIWQRNHALYPRGVDIILCADTTLTALPRSVSIEEA